MDLAIKRFGWLKTPLFREQNEAWRTRQQQLRESFESVSATANSDFFGATSNLLTGMATLAAVMASERIEAKTAQVKASVNKLV